MNAEETGADMTDAEGDAGLKDDIAYMRAMAEEGRNTPLIGGVHYVIWGALVGGAAFFTWLVDIGAVRLPANARLWLWVGVFVAGWGASIALGRRGGAKPGAQSIGSRTARNAWYACGVFMTVLWVALLFVHGRYENIGVPRYFLMSMMFPVAFGLYGVAFFAAAAAARASWMRYVSCVSWAASFTLLFVLTDASYMLIASLAMFAVVLAPGVWLMRQEPSEIV